MEIKGMIAQVIEEAVKQAFPGVETGMNYESLLEVPPESVRFDEDCEYHEPKPEWA